MDHPDAYAVMEQIARAGSPEEAARLGRATQAQQPHLVRPDWDTAKLFVMEAALRVKVRRMCLCCQLWGSCCATCLELPCQHSCCCHSCCLRSARSSSLHSAAAPTG